MKDTKECEQESDKREIQDLFDETGTNGIDFTHHRIGVRKDQISKFRWGQIRHHLWPTFSCITMSQSM